MGHFDLIILLLGLIFWAAAWLPSKLINVPITLPMIWLVVGYSVAYFDSSFPDVNPLNNGVITEHLTELVIIISILSAGLKIDRSLSWRSWLDTWLLLGITMPLNIGLITLISIYFLNFPLPVALLLGAIIAPTDPVLASDIQVGPPGKGNEDDVRFALTSEAGLNDGLAFPFVILALLFAISFPSAQGILQWFAWDIVGKIALSIIAGVGIGYFAARIILKPMHEMIIREKFIAIALTFVAYGGTQLAQGYGFVGVFIAAHIFRHYEQDHKFHSVIYDFTEQVEKLIIPLLLVLMAIYIEQGIFQHLTWSEIGVAIISLVVIRPISGLIGLMFSKTSFYNKTVISIFGIRGIGSFYYLAYALNQTTYFNSYGSQLWRIAVLIVLISIIFHGCGAFTIFQKIKQNHIK